MFRARPSSSISSVLLSSYQNYRNNNQQQHSEDDFYSSPEQQQEAYQAYESMNDAPTSSYRNEMLQQQQQDDQQYNNDNMQQQQQQGGRLGRERAQEQLLAEQFASLHTGWQSKEDSRFDLFVEEKRKHQAFEEFDQRVQRAYSRAIRQHRVEVWNGVKRKLKRTQQKVTPTVLEEVNRAVSDRETWLRDVFTQIDADYRSGDADRQVRATNDIRAALDGRAGELLQSHYETKLEKRFSGPKKQKLMEQEMEDELDGPNISNDEVNRYANLKTNISAIEDAVVSRYGRAGREHWDILQSEKDAEYSKKLADAANIYQDLIEQQQSYDESTQMEPVKDYVRRVSRAQVRFRTAMEVEATREQLVDAHEFMKKQRAKELEERRVARYQAAQQMKKTGIPSEEVRRKIQVQSLDALNAELAQQVASEKDEARQRKKVFLQMVDELDYDAEKREGEDAMLGNLKEKFGYLGDEQIKQVLDETTEIANSMRASSQNQQQSLDSNNNEQQPQQQQQQQAAVTKQALWRVLNKDTWEDPFHVIHSARVQANKNFSELYHLSQPTKLRLGRKSTRGGASHLISGEEGKMLQDPWIEYHTFMWGMHSGPIHDLDSDGEKEYFPELRGWHVRDPKTRDIDFRYEKKLGRGMRWAGPKFYKLGVDAQNLESDRPMVEDASVTIPAPDVP